MMKRHGAGKWEEREARARAREVSEYLQSTL